MRQDSTQAFRSECRAAMVTEVSDDPQGRFDGLVGLCVLNPSGMFFHSITDGGCVHDELNRGGGTWHWPELS